MTCIVYRCKVECEPGKMVVKEGAQEDLVEAFKQTSKGRLMRLEKEGYTTRFCRGLY